MLNRLKISLILAPLALMMLVGVYIYSLWSEDRDRRTVIPYDATGIMNRDLLKFHQKRGSFPDKLTNLEGVVWERKDRQYLSDGRSMIHRNYFYIYTKVSPHHYNLWAIPIGRSRQEASTWFLSASPTTNRRWKGGPIEVDDIGRMVGTPSQSQLGVLGLTEQIRATSKDTEIPD